MPNNRGARLRAAGIWCLVALVAAAAAALYLGVVRDLEPYSDQVRVPWWALAVGFAAAELFVIHIHVRGSAHSLSLSELPLVIGLLLAAPQELVLAQIVGPALVLVFFSRGHSPRKLAFNLAQFALTATLTVTVLHALAPVPQEVGPGMWFATMVAVGIGVVRRPPPSSWRSSGSPSAPCPAPAPLRMYAADAVVAFTNTTLGLAGATLARAGPARGLAARRARRRPHARLPRLPVRAPRAPAAGVPLLGRPVALARAGRRDRAVRPAACAPASPSTSAPPRSCCSAAATTSRCARRWARTGSSRRMQPVAAGGGGRAARPASATSARWSWIRSARRSRWRATSASAGSTRVMVAPVPGETRLLGVMVLGEPLGPAPAFGASDLRLFEALAGHAGVSLEFDRLEQVIRRMRDLQGALERQAYRDPLTDLANRALFMRRVADSLARPAGTTTVLFIDLDDFKRINDHVGHAAGDAVLGGHRRPHPPLRAPGRPRRAPGRRRVRHPARGRRRAPRRGRRRAHRHAAGRGRSRSPAGSSGSAPASASRAPRPAWRSTPTTSCGAPTWPCTAPRRPARARCAPSRPTCTRTP